MHHVIVGAGPAGVIAAETLRKVDPGSSISVLGDEPEPPYSRMAIPYLLADQIDETGTYLRRQPNHFAERKIDVKRDKVRSVDPDRRTLILESGGKLSYDRLLIATGSRPSSPPLSGLDREGVHSCWTLEDSRRINALATSKAPVVLIGAGFIGSIILEALAARGVELTVVEMANRMVPRMMNEASSALLKKWCEKKGVRVLTSSQVESIAEASRGAGLSVRLAGGEDLSASLVITATGVRPSIEFLEGSGIETGEGIRVDDHLCTNHREVYAAGDVAEGRDFSTGEYNVQAIQPTAADHGRIAALNMAGRSVSHPGSVNMNVLDTLGLISSSFGRWDGIEGGESVEVSNPDRFEYLSLQFEGDVLIGASSLGLTEHVGVIRGLIQSRVKLGRWKEKLLEEPKRLMEAYLGSTHAIGVPTPSIR